VKIEISIFRLIFCFLLLTATYAFSDDEVKNYVRECNLLICFSSMENFNSDFTNLLKRIYDKNYYQIINEYSLQSRSSVGIDIFNNKELTAAGIDIKKPVVYVHISNESGYLLIPVSSKKTIKSFIDRNLSSLSYVFLGNYLALSKNNELLSSISKEKKLIEIEAFNIASKKLDFKWNNYFVWFNGSYLSEITSSGGVTLNINLPYSFTGLNLNFTKGKIELKGYSGIISDEQVRFINSIKTFNAKEKLNFIDYGISTPAFIVVLNLNIPLLYRYIQYLDKLDILGLKSFTAEIKTKYKLDFEKDFIFNGDGRIRIVAESIDTSKNYYVVYGCYGLYDVGVAKNFIDNLNQAIIKSGEKVYSFEMFTYPFYRYSTKNLSIYYGIIENDLIFSTDKDVLTNVVSRLFKKEGGQLEKYPSYLMIANTNLNPGVFGYIDVQSFLAEVKGNFQLEKGFFVDLKEGYLIVTPDSEGKPYGWNYKLEIFWNK
jgi:hypothetical protein